MLVATTKHDSESIDYVVIGGARKYVLSNFFVDNNGEKLATTF